MERKEYERQWRANNPDKVKAKQDRYHAKHGKAKALRKKNSPKYEAYKERERIRAVEKRRERRMEAIECLGGKCCKCGFDDERALQFDHIIPIRRKKVGTTNHGGCLSATEYKAIVENKPHVIQLLCANCHAIKTVQDRLIWMAGSNKREYHR